MVDGAPAHGKPQVGEAGQDDGDEYGRDQHEGVAHHGTVLQRLVDVEDGGHQGSLAQQAVLFGLGPQHKQRQRQGGTLATDVVIAAETVSIDVLGGQTGGNQLHIFCNGGLGDGTGNGGEHPARYAEEVEDILQENDQDDAGGALGKAGDGLHDDLHHGEHIDLCNVGKDITDGQADQNGQNIIEPVLDEVGDDAVLTEEGVVGHQLVDHRDHQAHHHGGEHTTCAKLAHGHQRAAVHRFKVHAHHVHTDTGEACDHGAVFFANLL